MGRTLPSSLITLTARPAVSMVEAFIVTRRDSTSVGFTTHVDTVTVAGVTCTPIAGGDPGMADFQVGVIVSTMSIHGATFTNYITEEDVRAGKWRGSIIDHYILDPSDVTTAYKIESGVIGEVTLDGGMYRFEFKSTTELTNQPVGSSTSPLCRNEFCDAKCTLNIASYQVSSTVSAIGSSASGTSATGTYRINTGGGASSPYTADAYGSGALNAFSTSNSITTTGLVNPAPVAVYKSYQGTSGNANTFTYTMPSLVVGARYRVRLHFCEIYNVSAGGQRIFDVRINGDLVIANLDVYQAAGGAYIAMIKEFDAIADGSGNITIKFTASNNSPDPSPIINAIEVYTTAVPAISGNGVTFSSNSNATGYYTDGTMECVSGQNVGVGKIKIKQHIKSGTTAIIVPQVTPYYPIAVGDVWQLTRACNKLPMTCNAVFGNMVNFNGERNLPTNNFIETIGRG